MATRFQEVLDRAMGEFWATVAESYPHVTTGDLSPASVSAFEYAASRAIVAWLEANSDGRP